MIAEGMREIRTRIDAACQRSGRSPSSVTLVAVAKGQPAVKVAEAVRCGITDIGENYMQEMLRHSAQLLAFSLKPNAEGQTLQWHFIGHLQRNKVKQILDTVSLIHSVDSISLAQEINKRAEALKIQEVLMEINLGGESNKSGVAVGEVEPLIRNLSPLSFLCLKGFMTVPPPAGRPEESRPWFRRLREIRDAINAENRYRLPLTELSMGMTHDFEVAIEEGATLVRIGTGIFGERR